MSQSRKSSFCLDPERSIPAFSLPWIHRDNWNDKEWFYSIEGEYFLLCHENNFLDNLYNMISTKL